jgi:hypothetical protein
MSRWKVADRTFLESISDLLLPDCAGDLKLFQITERGEKSGSHDGLSDYGFDNGTDPRLFQQEQGRFMRFGEDMEDLLHWTVSVNRARELNEPFLRNALGNPQRSSGFRQTNPRWFRFSQRRTFATACNWTA